MAGVSAAVDVLIATNSKGSSLRCLEILYKYCDNAFKEDDKFKKIKKSNDIFQESKISVSGSNYFQCRMSNCILFHGCPCRSVFTAFWAHLKF